jgi:hypothetical protein
MKKQKPLGVPADVAAIRKAISEFFDTPDENGQPIGSAFGAYVFYDYDKEPIYVGQTHEGLRGRVGRHMTNQRTDAVAMNVLDPFEVASIEVWPLRQKSEGMADKDNFRRQLDALEYTVFQKVLKESALGAVLNEKDMIPTATAKLPKSYRESIIPAELYEVRKHPDIRIARRANTIARLAQVISERDVSPGLRRTLLVQARRLEKLAAERFDPFKAAVPQSKSGEETGENVD